MNAKYLCCGVAHERIRELETERGATDQQESTHICGGELRSWPIEDCGLCGDGLIGNPHQNADGQSTDTESPKGTVAQSAPSLEDCERYEATVDRPTIECERECLLTLLRQCKFAFAATLAYLPTELNATREDVYAARKAIDAVLAAAPKERLDDRADQDCTIAAGAIRELEAERDAALAEAVALRKDAERYRWLCDTGWIHDAVRWNAGISTKRPEDWDAALDAAIAERKGK